MACTCNRRWQPTPFRAVPGASYPMTSAPSARTHTSLQHWYKHDSAADAMCYNYQTQTAKPAITTDIVVSSTEPINEAHSAVPHNPGVLPPPGTSLKQALRKQFMVRKQNSCYGNAKCPRIGMEARARGGLHEWKILRMLWGVAWKNADPDRILYTTHVALLPHMHSLLAESCLHVADLRTCQNLVWHEPCCPPEATGKGTETSTGKGMDEASEAYKYKGSSPGFYFRRQTLLKLVHEPNSEQLLHVSTTL